MKKILLSCLLLCAGVCRAETVCPSQELNVRTQTGTIHTFQTEVACTPEKRAQGYQFQTYIPENTGILFPSDRPKQFVMWMKDTPLPLDMLFINKQGIIVRIEQGQPQSEALIYSPKDTCAVLELKADTATRLGLKVGDRFMEEIFCLDKSP